MNNRQKINIINMSRLSMSQIKRHKIEPENFQKRKDSGY